MVLAVAAGLVFVSSSFAEDMEEPAGNDNPPAITGEASGTGSVDAADGEETAVENGDEAPVPAPETTTTD